VAIEQLLMETSPSKFVSMAWFCFAIDDAVVTNRQADLDGF